MTFIRLDMSNKTVKIEEVSSQFAGLGGRGLTSSIINTEVPADCHPIGADNKLVFAPGLLSGVKLVNSSRLSIGAKSPLTGGIKESNVGGTMSVALGRLGIKGVIVEGQALDEELFILKIDRNRKPSLIQAQEYKGLRTYELVKRLFHKHGSDNAIVCIGPAGEKRLATASIQATDVDGRPARAAGRGGLGAVMGSKGLKALIVEKVRKGEFQASDPVAFEKAAKFFAKSLKEHPHTSQILPAFGTARLVAPINAAGALPSYNCTSGTFPGWENISGERMTEIIKNRGGNPSHRGCSQCIIRCSNEYVDGAGEFVTSSLEYETIWAMGAMIGLDDLDTIAQLDFLCDDIGLDTMSAGVAMAIAMDAGYKDFGDREAVFEMINEIVKGTQFGSIIGNGPVSVGQHFNHTRVPVVKGQSIAAYDPRAIQGMAVTYATSPMGADHTAGWVVDKNLQSFGGFLDPHSAQGQVDISRDVQIQIAALDCTGLCLFVSRPLNETKGVLGSLTKMISARIGKPFSLEDYTDLGVNVLRTEREFNLKAGFTKEDDRLPSFFYEEPLSPNNITVDVSDDEMDRTFDFIRAVK